MKLKDVLLILNLIVFGTIIAIAVYIFQIGNRSRAVKCTSQVNLPALLPQKEHFGSSDNVVETEVDGFRVKAYRSLGKGTTTDRLPIFKFGDLAKRAQEYKLANKETEVNLDFAIYELNCGLWIGTDTTSDNYGKVTFDDCLGKAPLSGADKLIFTLVTAAQAGVNVRIVYQNPCYEGTTSESYSVWSNGDEIYKYLLIHTSFLKDLGANQGNGTLQVRRAFWNVNPCDPGQMHNKFMVVSHYKGDSGDDDYLNTTYTSTSNCTNSHGGGKGVQSGVMVNGNEGLYKSYRKYFDLIWENCVAIEDLEINELPRDHHGAGSVPSDDYVGNWYHNKGYTFNSAPPDTSTRTSAKTVLSTDEYFENFHNAVRACHESDSSCSCNCPEQVVDGGGACADLTQNVFEDGQCDYYYQKDAQDSRGGPLDDAWCMQGTATCSADYNNTTPIPTKPFCIYSACCGGECESNCSEYCKQCIKNEQICTTNTDCCSNSCVNGACASGDAADAPSGLNYISESISAYFYPMSEAVCEKDSDLWNVNQNGIAKIASFDITEWTNICYRWDTTGDSTNFSNKLLDSISKASSTPASAVQVGNSDDTIWTKFAEIGDIRSKSDSDPFIHAKDFTVKTSEGDEYVLTGSTNIEYYGVCSKGNNEIMIKSSDLFDFFQSTQSKAGRPTP